MAAIPSDLRYLASHEWCRLDGGVATIGITDFAQDQLGDVVFIELPAVGARLDDPQVPFGSIESVKAASDLYAPVLGEVVEVNAALEQRLDAINTDPYGEGWMIKVRMEDPSQAGELLDAEGYAAVVEAEG